MGGLQSLTGNGKNMFSFHAFLIVKYIVLLSLFYIQVNLNDVWSSSDSITWTEVTSSASWSERRGHTTVVLNNQMILMGGYNGDYLSLV